MGIEYREKIISLARQKGPLLPADVAKFLKTDTLFASAMLSEMNENKILVISTLKVGGSPLYYLPEHAGFLEKFLGNLNEKDRKVFELLKNNKLLKDMDQELFVRYSLRQLRDFAKPIHISHGQEADLYWRFYQVSDQDALAFLSPKKIKIPIHETPQSLIHEEEHIVHETHETPHEEQKQESHRKPKTLEEDSLYIKAREFCLQKNISIENVDVISHNHYI